MRIIRFTATDEFYKFGLSLNNIHIFESYTINTYRIQLKITDEFKDLGVYYRDAKYKI